MLNTISTKCDNSQGKDICERESFCREVIKLPWI